MRRRTLAIIGVLLLTIPAFAGTWTSHSFIYKPSTGARGEAEKQTFDNGLDRVDARLVKETWLGDPGGSPGYDTLSHAITTIASTSAILRLPPCIISIDTDTTIPANITLKPERGAIFSIASGRTLTIIGGLEAGLYQIFSCADTGKVVFGTRSVKELYPEWWGITGTADDVAINAAIFAGNNCKATVKLAPGSNYALADTVLVPNGSGAFAIEGYGATLNGAALNKPIMQVGDFTGTTPVTQYIRISGFCISGAGHDASAYAAHPAQDGLTIGNASTITVRDLKITSIPNVGINGKKAASGSRYWDSISFYNVKVNGCGSSGMSIGRLNEADTSVQPADNIYLYNCTFNELCRAVDRGGFDSDYAGVYIASNLIAWFGGQVAAVGLVATPANGAQLGLYTTSNVMTGLIDAVHFERVGLDQANSRDICVSSSTGLVISSSTHSGNHAEAAKTAIYIGGAKNVTVLSPNFSGGASRMYDYGVDISNSRNCIVTGAGVTSDTYPCNTALVNISTNSVFCKQDKGRTVNNTSNATSASNETNLSVVSAIPASFLSANGGIKIFAAGTKTGTETKTIKLYFGSTAWTVFTGTSTDNWRLEATIYNTTAANQRVSWVFYNGSQVTSGYETATENTAVAVTPKLTGQVTSYSSGVITQTMMSVEGL